MDTASSFALEKICAREKCKRPFTAARATAKFCCSNCAKYALHEDDEGEDKPFTAPPGCGTCQHHENLSGTIACRRYLGLICKPGLLSLHHEPMAVRP